MFISGDTQTSGTITGVLTTDTITITGISMKQNAGDYGIHNGWGYM
jgi:hypothetical protein